MTPSMKREILIFLTIFCASSCFAEDTVSDNNTNKITETTYANDTVEMTDIEVEQANKVFSNQGAQDINLYYDILCNKSLETEEEVQICSELYSVLQEYADTEDQLQENYDALNENQNSLKNRLLTSASIAGLGIGGLKLAQGLAEQNADKDAQKDMEAYLNAGCDRIGTSGASNL